jgi:hypothetical protein
LPTRFVPVIVPFAALFRQRTWRHARALLLGAIRAPGVRTVASVLRIRGLAHERRFCRYHRVLSRAVWSPRAASRLLLLMLVRAFAPNGPLVVGIDDTIERRGTRIRAKGIDRDAVRSSHSHFVKASGLRWLSVMLLAPIPWAGRVWALPFLTALAPSPRYSAEAGRRHKRLTDWARQLLLQVRRWLPGRALVMVADSSFAALDLLAALAPRMTCITRRQLDARLFTPAPTRRPGTNGRPRLKGEWLPLLSAVRTDSATGGQRLTAAGWYGEGARDIELATGTAVRHHPGLPLVPLRWVLVRDPLGRFDPKALLSTDLALSAVDVVGYFVRRWQVEVTIRETRRHLGVETQRQWSDAAVARTTPVLLALFSLVTLLAARLVRHGHLPVRTAAWYTKRTPTFNDALAAVRAHWWRWQRFRTSPREADMVKLPRHVVRRLSEAACYAASMAKVELKGWWSRRPARAPSSPARSPAADVVACPAATSPGVEAVVARRSRPALPPGAPAPRYRSATTAPSSPSQTSRSPTCARARTLCSPPRRCVTVASRRSSSPGMTASCQTTPVTDAKYTTFLARSASSSSRRTPPIWASASRTSSPGITGGAPSHSPAGKNHSWPVTCFRPTHRTPRSSSVTASTSRNGGRCGRTRRIAATSRSGRAGDAAGGVTTADRVGKEGADAGRLVQGRVFER